MQLAPRRQFLLGLAATSLAVLGMPAAASAADGQEVQFETADYVTLKGTFYPGNNGNKSPAVILLHEFGSDRTKGGWDALAKELQKKGFAVLTFDFRGHNDSCTVANGTEDAGFIRKNFWTFPMNAQTFRRGKTGDTIDHKDIRAKKFTYLPWMTNDIQAAKRYLEQRNDANDCNVSNLCLIGAKEGAALGAYWMFQEQSHKRIIPNPINPNFPPTFKNHSEDLAGAVWLSAPEKLYASSLGKMLATPSIRDKVPMLFVYGTKDEVSARAADGILREMKKGTSAKVPAATRELKIEGKASGSELLGKEDAKIANYLFNVLEKRAEKPWDKRDSSKLPLELTK
jgi:pimeloyl-ACP methyl ester carboxylesterase